MPEFHEVETARPPAGIARLPFAPILLERRISSVFQPVFDVRSGVPYGFEALSRDVAGSPTAFPAELAESMRTAGRAREFNRVCLRAAIASFRDLDLPGRLLVNIDPGVLSVETVVEMDDALRTGGGAIDWRRVVVEVTESARSDPAALADAIGALRARGASVALDDFGEGFASLRSWSEVRPQIVKIDRHFCHCVDTDAYKLEFVRSLMRLASRLGILVIAEGIETEAELLTLVAQGVRLVQGFLTGRPEPRPARRLDVALGALAANAANAQRSASDDTIATLCLPAVAIPPSETVDQAFERFEADPGLRLLPVIDHGTPVGLIERTRLTAFLAPRFRRELFGRCGVMRAVEHAPLVLEDDTPCADAARLFASRGDETLDAGILVTSGGSFVGVIPGAVLLRSISERQLQDARLANPLTQLPGNLAAERALDSMLADGRRFCLAWVDIDHFKPFNDTHGFSTGDQVLRLLASLLQQQNDGNADFVGHVGGDDFVVIFQGDDWPARLADVARRFELGVLQYFDAGERASGGFEAHDRDGAPRRYRLMSLSIGVLAVPGRCSLKRSTLMRRVALAKSAAKLEPGSAIVTFDVDDPVTPRSIVKLDGTIRG